MIIANNIVLVIFIIVNIITMFSIMIIMVIIGTWYALSSPRFCSSHALNSGTSAALFILVFYLCHSSYSFVSIHLYSSSWFLYHNSLSWQSSWMQGNKLTICVALGELLSMHQRHHMVPSRDGWTAHFQSRWRWMKGKIRTVNCNLKPAKIANCIYWAPLTMPINDSWNHDTCHRFGDSITKLFGVDADFYVSYLAMRGVTGLTHNTRQRKFFPLHVTRPNSRAECRSLVTSWLCLWERYDSVQLMWWPWSGDMWHVVTPCLWCYRI